MRQPLSINREATLFPYSCRWSQHNILQHFFVSRLLNFDRVTQNTIEFSG